MSESEDAIPTTRGYQQEMLEESLRGNIIIALDTGSGKTHIAVLRIKIEVERQPTKVRNSMQSQQLSTLTR
jgi:ERCC4-related helicase